MAYCIILSANCQESSSSETIIICVICWLFCGIITALIYESKGYNGGFWVGFLFGAIGLIIAICLPAKMNREDAETNSREEESLPRAGKYVFCKKCGFLMPKEQTTCSNCGATLIEEEKENVPETAQYVLCPNCGFPIYDDEEKCSNCGTKREDITADTRSDEKR